MDTASHAVVGVLGIKHHAHEGSLTYLCLEPAKPDLEPFPRTLNLKIHLSETGTFNGTPQTPIRQPCLNNRGPSTGIRPECIEGIVVHKGLAQHGASSQYSRLREWGLKFGRGCGERTVKG